MLLTAALLMSCFLNISLNTTNQAGKSLSEGMAATTTTTTPSTDLVLAPSTSLDQAGSSNAPPTDVAALASSAVPPSVPDNVEDPNSSSSHVVRVEHGAPPAQSEDAASTDVDLPSSSRRRSQGRRKIEMKKIEKESNLLVAFSKRKGSLFKKTSELATMCGAQAAVILFSPSRKVYSFGNPSADALVNRYVAEQQQNINNPDGQDRWRLKLVQQTADAANVQNRSAKMDSMDAFIEGQINRGQELEERHRARMAVNWWERPATEIDPNQLTTLHAALDGLEKNATDRQAQIKNNFGPSSSRAFPFPGEAHFSPNNASGAGPSGHNNLFGGHGYGGGQQQNFGFGGAGLSLNAPGSIGGCLAGAFGGTSGHAPVGGSHGSLRRGFGGNSLGVGNGNFNFSGTGPTGSVRSSGVNNMGYGSVNPYVDGASHSRHAPGNYGGFGSYHPGYNSVNPTNPERDDPIGYYDYYFTSSDEFEEEEEYEDSDSDSDEAGPGDFGGGFDGGFDGCNPGGIAS